MNTERLKREKEFHDTEFEEENRASLSPFYRTNKNAYIFFHQLIISRSEKSDVLEVGCGPGRPLLNLLSQKMKSFTGIDLSTTGVEKASALYTDKRFKFLKMDANHLTFKDESFDFVFGTAILHHLEFDQALKEVHRVLKPGGSAIFFEPLAHNPAIQCFRMFTPKKRTIDEAPITKTQLNKVSKDFPHHSFHFFGLSTLAAAPFHNSKRFPRFINALNSLDQTLFKYISPFRYLSWTCTIEIMKK